jgi:hypothetical protein
MNRLFSNQTANGTSQSAEWAGGDGVMFVAGTPNGATIALEASPDDGKTYVSAGASLANSTGTVAFSLPPCRVRATLSSAGASTNLSVWVGKVLPSLR